MKQVRRWDHELIFNLIEPASSVLDLGCGDGALLARLSVEKEICGQAVETDPSSVSRAIQKGVAVYQKDLDQGLPEFKDKSFDYVILEKTLQVLHRPVPVLEEMLRIGQQCIVSFPNFSYQGVVEKLLQTGRMPVTGSLPYQWYDTPNIHLFTLYDFLDWVESHKVEVVDGFAAGSFGCRPLVMPDDSTGAEELLFLLKRD
jgi:methionine biosynthesis protein MetW